MFTQFKDGWPVRVPMENLFAVTSNRTQCNHPTQIAEKQGSQVPVYLCHGVYTPGYHGEQGSCIDQQLALQAKTLGVLSKFGICNFIEGIQYTRYFLNTWIIVNCK